MRDLLVAAIVFGSLPFILRRPFIGIIVWSWLSFMNPHQLAWGFARGFPFAKVVAGVTLVSGALNPAVPKQFRLGREGFVLLLFCLWMFVTTLLALNPEEAWLQMEKVMKIQIVTFATMMLITTERRLQLLIWMIVVSIGFYGVKGGIFTIVSGGGYHVLGPPRAFISGSNGLGLALVMVIPLMRYLQKTNTHVWVRHGLTASMILTALATLGTQSRGAAIGLVAMLAFMVLKGRGKIYLLAVALIMVPLTMTVMPQKWFDRMDGIRNYEEDESAMGRINAWKMSTNLALDRPLAGGGFNCFTPRWFAMYAPEPNNVHDSHSIYFEVLAEHGFVGLFLFSTLALLTWRTCTKIARQARRHDETAGLSELARMVQVSMFSYAIAGAFVGMAYFDLYYTLIAIVVISKVLVTEYSLAPEPESDAPRVPGNDLAPRWVRAQSRSI